MKMIDRGNGWDATHAIMGCSLLCLGVFLTSHHPFGSVFGAILFGIFFGLGFYRPRYSLLLIPGALPVIDFTPWSGWITFEEFDLLVLALVSGACLRFAFSDKPKGAFRNAMRISLGAKLLLVVFSLSLLVAMLRGLDDAGGVTFGWYQGYFEPMNSIRLAKSFFLALCFLTIFIRCYRETPDQATRLLILGMVTGLGFACVAAIWERVAFTGLLDFSSDYRTTALFWEMHVGGAAFDGFLALTVPFAVWAFMRTTSKGYLVFFGSILALSAYACLTTFSRGVYLAIPVGLFLTGVLAFRNVSKSSSIIFKGEKILIAIPFVCFFGGAAYWIFPTSGYRGMLAFGVAIVMFYPVSLAWGKAKSIDSLYALLVAIAAGVFCIVVGGLLAKGAYFVFSFGVALSTAGLWFGRRGMSQRLLFMTVTGYSLTLLGCFLVALHWGGQSAIGAMGVVSALLFIAFLATHVRSLPEQTPRWHASLLSVLVMVGFSVAAFSGGEYMTSRFGTSDRDFAARLQHWENALGKLNTMDWWLGKGLGRFPASYFFSALGGQLPDSYRYVEEEGNGYLLLGGGLIVNGWGELFRVTQRVTPSIGPYTVKVDVRTVKDMGLHFEVCEKHLLYNGACSIKEVGIKGNEGVWQKVQARLTGDQPNRGDWFAPKLIAFSVAMGSRGELANLDNLELLDGYGENLLSNGDFSHGLAHWFSSSDKYHMPWHMKNLFLHTLFEQGWFGLVMLIILTFSFFVRLTVGAGRYHPMAPVLLGSLSGFLVVGFFDSLLDVPRVASLFYFILMTGLVLNDPRSIKGPIERTTKRVEIASQGI